MRPRASRILVLLVLPVMLLVSACQDSDARAEEHYQRALELIAEGDRARAAVEFRNVFQINGNHRAARSDFAAMLIEDGDVQGAYSQYLRLVEQYPDEVEGRIVLAELALLDGNFEEAERHGQRARALAADEPRVAIINLNLQYIQAIADEDAPARRDVSDQIMDALQGDPENQLLLRMAVDSLIRDGDLEGALGLLDQVIAGDPENRMFYDAKLSILAEQERADDVEALLREMLVLFQDDQDLPGMVLRFYLGQGRSEDAAAFLQEQADAAADDAERNEALSALLQLRLVNDGPEAALSEVEAIIASQERVDVFRIQRAALLFDLGEQDTAISTLQSLLEGELAARDSGHARVALAQMLLSTGNSVGARAQVERVLEEDATQVDALRMQAAWLIEEDETDRAISTLRTALDEDPNDSQALTLMASAHARNGNRQLARDFLALAVEASNAAPAETLRYVQTLVEEERYLVAEEFLINALRRSSNNLDLLLSLGDVYIRMEDWPRAEQVEVSLRETDTPEFQRAADGLRTSRLAAQGRLQDALSFLEAMAADGGTEDVRAQVAVVRARLLTGDTEGALAYAEGLLAEEPDNLAYRFALAAVFLATGDLEQAEASYREIVAQEPRAQDGWIGLLRTLSAQGRADEATEVLQQALEVLPNALDLLWAQASQLERFGDYEGAIAIYEDMYARAPNAQVIANNLASLLSTYRDDDESLDRAWAVARRLRGIEQPAFQDTYGWLAYRRGEYGEAIDHLEPAAQGLPDDPLVQYHLGMAYVAVERPDEALEQLLLAVELAGPEDTREQFDTARAEIARLQTALEEASEEAATE